MRIVAPIESKRKQANPMSLLFCDPMTICDKDRISWDDSEYLVRLYPAAHSRIQVEVDLIEGGATIGIFSRVYADNDADRIHEAVFDCIQEISEIV